MAIIREAVDREPIFSADDMLEIMSMLKPETLKAIEASVVMARYIARSDQLEGDISKQADPILTRQIKLADLMIELIQRARHELESLNEVVT